MSLGICRAKLLAERGDAGVALGELRLLRGNLRLLGSQRLGLLLDAGFLLGDELLETLELACIGSGSDLRNSRREACLGLLGRELRRGVAGLGLCCIAGQDSIVCTLLCSLGALLRGLQLVLEIVDLLLGGSGAGTGDGHSAIARVVRCLHAIQGACDDSRLGDVFALREIINHRHVLEG